MYKGLHVKYPLFLSDFNEFEFSRQILEKKTAKNQISWKSAQWEPRYSMKTDMTKLIVVFRIANASKKEKKKGTLYGKKVEFINSLAAGT